jgi:hypothetical protein
MANIQESYPAQTTGLGVAAKIAVQGNLGTSTKPGYNNVTLSVGGTNGQTTFQLNPQIQDASGAAYDPSTDTVFAITSVANSSPGSLTLTSVAASVNGDAVYAGTITSGGSNAFVGLLFTVAGFTGANNNGTFVCVASTTLALTLANVGATAETHAGTATSEEGTAVYTGTIGVKANSLVGQTFVIAGFVTNPSNNGTFICTANNGSTTITLENNFAVSETATASATSQESSEPVFTLTSVATTSGGVAVYTGTIGVAASSLVGKTFTVTGFVTTPANNGTFVATANNGSTTLTLANTAAVSETHAATATGVPLSNLLTYVAYPAKTLTGNTYQPSGTSTAVATVSTSGVITAVAPGGVEVEVSFPAFNNTSGTTGNTFAGNLPLGKIYATVNVQVLP